MESIDIRLLLCLLADDQKLDPEVAGRILKEILLRLCPPDRAGKQGLMSPRPPGPCNES